MRLPSFHYSSQQPSQPTLITSAILLVLRLLTLPISNAADITFSLPPVPSFPNYNPSSLPSNTKATLFRHAHTTSVLLTRRNTFEFRNLSQGSWLFTVQCRDYTFGPLRVDVLPVEDQAQGDAAQKRKEKVEVYQTFWGNEWGNKGEYRGGGVVEIDAKPSSGADGVDAIVQAASQPTSSAVVIQVFPSALKEYYMVRAGFSPLQFLKNPMILMALFSLGLIVAIPYITDNMDEETRAEFEEMQRKSPVAQATSGASNLQNFDLASWMAGKSTGNSTPRSSTPTVDSAR